MHSSYRALVFLEFEDEAKAFLDFLPRQTIPLQEILVVPLSPRVRFFLKDHGVEGVWTTDYFPNSSHEKGSRRLAEVLGFLRKNFEVKDEWGISTSYQDTLIFYSQTFLGHLFWLSELLHQIIGSHTQVKNLICVEMQGQQPYGPFLTEFERPLAAVMKKFAEVRELAITPISLAGTMPSPRSQIVKWGEEVLFTGISYFVHGLNQIGLKKLKNKGKRVVWLNTVGYRVNHLVRDLQAQAQDMAWLYVHGVDRPLRSMHGSLLIKFLGYSLISAVGHFFSLMRGKKVGEEKLGVGLDFIFDIGLLTHLQKRAAKNSTFVTEVHAFPPKLWGAWQERPEVLSYEGVSLAELYFEKLSQGIIPMILHSYYCTRAFWSCLSELRPQGMISASNINGTSTLGELGQLLQIPGVLISHGSHVSPTDEILETEYERHGRYLINSHYPYVAVQSALAEGYLDYFRVPSKRIVTGPLLWGKISRPNPKIREQLGISPDKKILLHASTQKPRDSFRFTLYETLDEYLQSMVDLARACEGLKQAVLVIKFRPSDNLSLEDLQRSLAPYSNVVISVKENFLEVLLASQLLVSFSSTTMEEALENFIPVLQYGANGRLNFLPSQEYCFDRRLSRGAVYWVRKQEHLVPALNEILALFEGEQGQAPLREEDLEGYRIPDSKRLSLNQVWQSSL